MSSTFFTFENSARAELKRVSRWHDFFIISVSWNTSSENWHGGSWIYLCTNFIIFKEDRCKQNPTKRHSCDYTRYRYSKLMQRIRQLLLLIFKVLMVLRWLWLLHSFYLIFKYALFDLFLPKYSYMIQNKFEYIVWSGFGSSTQCSWVK